MHIVQKAIASAMKRSPRISALALIFAAISIALAPAQSAETKPDLPTEIGIVVADSEQASVAAQMWLNAAREQGLPARIVTAGQVVSDWRDQQGRFAGLVLPDELARNVSSEFVSGLQQYVDHGGRLLVVFDAALMRPDGRYALDRSVLSGLVGVNYAMSERLGDKMFRRGPVFASSASAKVLGLPPGLAVEDPEAAAQAPFNLRLRTYSYPEWTTASLETDGPYDGEPLLVGHDGQIVAGIRKHGEGRIIFANLPIGTLKLTSTNGWPLHRFLRLLAIESGLPVLAMTPGAVGGMVLNIHVDAASAIKPLEKMVASGFFNDGPFSVHVTAGPDVNEKGDKKGIDVPHNKSIQTVLRNLALQGHEVGSHGGWIHNYWAKQVNEGSAERDAYLLELNVDALASATKEPIRVYSAPGGQHPVWVTDWLRQHDFLAYYTTANSDSAPTRGYRRGEPVDAGVWSFPIAICGETASFEEMFWAKLDEQTQVTPWLTSLTRFTADEHEVRLFYFHPTGVHLFEPSVAAMITEARSLHDRFRWYTMAELSRFLSRREETQWSISRRDGNDLFLKAENSNSLRDMTWLVPAHHFIEPRLIEGTAEITLEGSDWKIKATDGKTLVVHLGPGAGLPKARTDIKQQ
ncbi:polysaccharide deacetylase family protein [Bradyrhizobium diazoefficiens]|nr:polysaccharide deacetylase family protein [Bradyrhizobium diazoefficiens]MBR0778622.1 polysaccharide deacetylase family protein [Bradyrhizobium diazoefficiens]